MNDVILIVDKKNGIDQTVLQNFGLDYQAEAYLLMILSDMSLELF